MREPGVDGSSTASKFVAFAGEATPSSSCDSLPTLVQTSSSGLHRVGSQQENAPGAPRSRVGAQPMHAP